MSCLSTRVVPAYAKLNLSLEIVARRTDGWHDIDSVLVPIDWHDLVGLSVEPAGADSQVLKVDGPAAGGVPAGDGNLTMRAAVPSGNWPAGRSRFVSGSPRACRTVRVWAADPLMPPPSFERGRPC